MNVRYDNRDESMKLKQLLKAIVSIILGNLTSIIIDFFLSFLGPIGSFPFYPKIIGVMFGGFVAGLVFKKRGWLIGIIISIIHIIYTILILSYPHTYLTEKIIKIDWLLILPSGIFILAAGLIGGYFGEKMANKMFRSIQGEEKFRP